MIAVYILSATFCGTCVYNAQNDLARAAYPAAERPNGVFRDASTSPST